MVRACFVASVFALSAVLVVHVCWLLKNETWKLVLSPSSSSSSSSLSYSLSRSSSSVAAAVSSASAVRDIHENFNNSDDNDNDKDDNDNSKPYYYTDPLADIPSGITFDDLPVPIQVMEEYKQWHSVTALQRDADLSHRKFAIGFYTCPIQAGNRLHHFFNSLLWAILSNRTLLWAYWDPKTCMKWSQQEHICNSSNHVQDCDQILARADWLPSYDEWSQKLSLDPPVEIPFYANHPKSKYFYLYPWHDGDEKLFGADDRVKYPMQVAVFAVNVGPNAFLMREPLRNELLKTDHARTTYDRLFSLGMSFMYGMLHRYCFDFAPLAKKGLVGYHPPPPNTAFTIALHSRHRSGQLDGCDVRREIKCLLAVMEKHNKRPKRPVQVHLMTDRTCTITKLTRYLHSRNITTLVAPHEEGGSFLGEHGPFAGVGFYQDLALVSLARSAFIGSVLTSSALLRELLVFHSQLEAWKQKQQQQQQQRGRRHQKEDSATTTKRKRESEMAVCIIPRQNVTDMIQEV